MTELARLLSFDWEELDSQDKLALYRAAIAQARAELDAHVEKYRHAPPQGSQEWIDVKSQIIGGSELATLLGKNPYSSRNNLLARKLGLDAGSVPGVACWWGTMFEPVSERILELQCGTELVGSAIHMRDEGLIVDHGNSPDGFCVLLLQLNPEGGWEITSDLEASVAEGKDVAVLSALVELKSPYRRVPKGSIPPYYVPQVLSGISFTPAACIGVYLEVAYRVCSLPDLGGSGEYCLEYHTGDKKTILRSGKPIWERPIGWGATAIYAPYRSTPSQGNSEKKSSKPAPSDFLDNIGGQGPGGKVSGSREYAASAAYKILANYFRQAISAEDLGEQIADLGDLANEDPALFDEVMEYVDLKGFIAVHSEPVLLDCSSDDSGLGEFLRDAEANSPAGHYLLGILPWKVFQADYHLVSEDEEFFETIQPMVTSFMEDKRKIEAAGGEEKDLGLIRRAYLKHCQLSEPTAAEKHSRMGISPQDISALFSAV